MLKDFLSRLFPPQLIAYIPGRKLVAAVVVYALTEAFGADAGLVNLPAVGEVDVNELATLVAFYLWPESEDAEIEAELAADVEPELTLNESDKIVTG